MAQIIIQNMEAAQGVKKPAVNIIPVTERSVENEGQIKKQKYLRVAVYCRVSTEDKSQQTSYTTQKAFYTEMITGRLDTGGHLCG